jgi:hypothetical protein
MIEIDGSIVRGLGSNIERDRKNYTEVVVSGFYAPTLRTLACRMTGRRTAALNQFPALISTARFGLESRAAKVNNCRDGSASRDAGVGGLEQLRSRELRP